MKKLIIIAVFIIFVVKIINLTNTEYTDSSNNQINTQQSTISEIKIVTPIPVKPHEKPKPKVKKKTFKCDNRKHCSQMRSYEEAKYFLRHCRGVKMDGDNDGIPCERQFRK